MPAVLIHGVPDSCHIWELVRHKLKRRDILAPSLPGFGTSIPPGFSCSKEDYLDWLIRYLETLGQPVDLVGHDWGCILAMRIVSIRPDLIRSWAAGSGPVSKDYEWHPLAKVWQAPGAGEEWMERFDAPAFAQYMTQAGLPCEKAQETVSRIDDTMKASILRLYRSAVSVGSEWQPGLHQISTPGLVFWGKNDRACPVAFAEQLGRDSHARRVLTFDSNHWVIAEQSAAIAQALEEHWALIDTSQPEGKL